MDDVKSELVEDESVLAEEEDRRDGKISESEEQDVELSISSYSIVR